MLAEKLLNIINNDSIWLMYDVDGTDPYFRKYITNNVIVNSYAIVSKSKCYLFVNSLDYDNVKKTDGVIEFSSSIDLEEKMIKVLKELNFPKNIYLNYSEDFDITIDVLGHGTYLKLTKYINNLYQKQNKELPEFKSAENLLYNLIDRKSDEEIEYLKLAATRALEILEETFRNIKVGMTEIEIASLTQSIFTKKPDYFKTYNIASEEYAWDKEGCPIVLVGPSLLKGGHANASNEVLKHGYTVYFDFGVTLILKDGRKFSSDIQRMGYVLNKDEEVVTKEVERVFDTLVNAIELGRKNCIKQNKGYIIDEIVRNYITESGYPNYNHATGHPVGENAHNPGTLIAPKGSKRSELYLQENGVYTIEPRIAISNGGSIEEMILVTKEGGSYLCKPQKKLYIIK